MRFCVPEWGLSAIKIALHFAIEGYKLVSKQTEGH
jgi:hypothetical protein